MRPTAQTAPPIHDIQSFKPLIPTSVEVSMGSECKWQLAESCLFLLFFVFLGGGPVYGFILGVLVQWP
jgi:hypothetical protein